MLELIDATKTISLPSGGNLHVLRGVSLQIAAGESLADWDVLAQARARCSGYSGSSIL